MTRLRKLLLGLVALLVLVAAGGWAWLSWYGSRSMDPAFFDDAVAAFGESDAASPAAPGGVVFTGSSSIRLWSSLEQDMAPIAALNRGFGGAHCAHLRRHARTLTEPYAPRAVVVYCGDNDLGAGKSGDVVLDDFQAFRATVREALGAVPVLFVAIKPSILRWDNWPEIARTNARVAALATADPSLRYVDIATPMLGADGRPRKELFVFDGLHLSAEGYAVWTRALRPVLEAALSDGDANP